jgi:predicted HTH transcriptional regulator
VLPFSRSKLRGIKPDFRIKENLSKLKEKKLIERIGPDKGGHWIII